VLVLGTVRHADIQGSVRPELPLLIRIDFVAAVCLLVLVPLAFATGNAALVCIPVALYRGDALHVADRTQAPQHRLDRWFRTWRRAATALCGLSLPLMVPALDCVAATPSAAPSCAAWLAPPRTLHRALHPDADPAALADAAQIAAGVYGVYLIASVGVVLRAMGRR